MKLPHPRLISAASADELADYSKETSPTRTCISFDTFDMTLSQSTTFDDSPVIAVTSSYEKNTKPHSPLKFKTPERRKARRSSVGNGSAALSKSLPPALMAATSFDSILDDEEPCLDRDDVSSIQVSEGSNSQEVPRSRKAATDGKQRSIFRPLKIRHGGGSNQDDVSTSASEKSDGLGSTDNEAQKKQRHHSLFHSPFKIKHVSSHDSESDRRDGNAHVTETNHSKKHQDSMFRSPLPMRKTRSSPVKNKLSKSLTISPSKPFTMNVLSKDLEIPLANNKSFDHDSATTSWFPIIEHSQSLTTKRSVRFSSSKPEVHLINFPQDCASDYYYSTEEIARFKSIRYEEAAFFRSEMNDASPSTVDDLDVSRRQKVLCIDTLLSKAFNYPDENPFTSIRGIEHFVYPELQHEMIDKKKEVQAQVMLYVRSKRPDPQGWRLANHSKKYSQWARDVALQKGSAYRMKHDESQSQPIKEVKAPLRRRDSRRSSVCGSMNALVGSSAASAAAVRLEFDQANSSSVNTEKFQELPSIQLQPHRRSRNKMQSMRSLSFDFVNESEMSSSVCGVDEWREEYDEA